MAQHQPTILPYFALQHDFATVFADLRDHTIVSEDIFLSCYKSGSPSVHGKVNASLDPVSAPDIALEGRDGVDLKRVGTHAFHATCPVMGVENASLKVPRQTFSTNVKDAGIGKGIRPITAFDISPDGSLIASGHLDGSVSLESTSSSDTASQIPLTTKQVHLSTVHSLRFFPSSKVLLSASGDLSLNILSADSSASTTSALPLLATARTLKGHKAAITDTHIVGVGKQVYSCGKDGSVRLWDVGQALKVGTTMVSEGFAGILRMSVQGTPDVSGNPSDTPAAHVIYAALQNGTFNVFDARAGHMVYASPLPAKKGSASPLLSIASSSSSNLLALGSSSGVVSLYDTRNLPSSPPSLVSPLMSFKRSDSEINDLQFPQGQPSSLLVATGDGFPFRVSISSDRVEVEEEYAAHDDQGIQVIRWNPLNGGNGASIWTAGDDGIVRRY